MPALKLSSLSPSFNLRSLSARSLGLAIEHLPCCILSIVAASIGIPFLRHNPVLELGFAIGGALIGEYVGHKYIFNARCAPHDGHNHESHRHGRARRYALALTIGLATWGLHQAVFHRHPHEQDARILSEATHAQQVITGRPATPTTTPAR